MGSQTRIPPGPSPLVTMKIITSTQVGTTGDVTGLAVDLSADGKTLMAAYTSKHAQAGRALLYQIEPV